MKPKAETRLNGMNEVELANIEQGVALPSQQERKLDGKFSIRGGQVVNTVSGEAIPEDEPLFLLRGRDHNAIVAINAYQGACESECNELHMAGIQQVREKFCQFAAYHPERMKQPGITKHLKLEVALPSSPAPTELEINDKNGWVYEPDAELAKVRAGLRCRNPNHACTDGTIEPHEIGSSCMAESVPSTPSPTQFEDDQVVPSDESRKLKLKRPIYGSLDCEKCGEMPCVCAEPDIPVGSCTNGAGDAYPQLLSKADIVELWPNSAGVPSTPVETSDAVEEARTYLMEKFSDRFSMEAIASAAYILVGKDKAATPVETASPDECQRCHKTMLTRDGEEPTEICDHCAHEKVAELESQLTQVREELQQAIAALRSRTSTPDQCEHLWVRRREGSHCAICGTLRIGIDLSEEERTKLAPKSRGDKSH